MQPDRLHSFLMDGGGGGSSPIYSAMPMQISVAPLTLIGATLSRYHTIAFAAFGPPAEILNSCFLMPSPVTQIYINSFYFVPHPLPWTVKACFFKLTERTGLRLGAKLVYVIGRDTEHSFRASLSTSRANPSAESWHQKLKESKVI